MSSSNQRKLILTFMAGFNGPDYKMMSDVMHENFTHRFRPTSINGMGKPVRSKQEFLSHVSDVFKTFEFFNFLPPEEIIEGKDADGRDVVIIHIFTDGRTISGKPYNNEYIFIFRFQDDKILSIKEFMDSKYVLEIIAGEEAAAAHRAK